MSEATTIDRKYTIMELGSYDRERHMPLEKAYEMIQAQGDENLPTERLKKAAEAGDIKVYEFKGQQYVDRLDVGRVYHRSTATQNGLTIERYFTKEW
jgi:hypothetical protein